MYASKIFLIGPMGVGKTTLGKKLACYLNYNFVDCDKLLQKQVNMSIGEFILKYSEDSFRDIESQILCRLNNSEKLIIATGGGVVLRKQNQKILQTNQTVIALDADPNILFNKLQNTANRALQPKTVQEYYNYYNQRLPLYKAMATDILRVDLDNYTESLIKLFKICDKQNNVAANI